MVRSLFFAIVRIHNPSAEVVGTGFLVNERHILTCAHVVAYALDVPQDAAEPPEADLELDFPLRAAGQMLAARVCHWQPSVDVAGLQLLGWAPPGAEPVRLIATDDDLWGHPFRAFGFPQGYAEGAWASGVIRGRRADGWVQMEGVKQTGYLVQPGFSGGPVWDEVLKGVVGMVVAADTDERTKAAFLIPADLLAQAWPEQIQTSSPPPVEEEAPAAETTGGVRIGDVTGGISGTTIPGRDAHVGAGPRRWQFPRGAGTTSGRVQLSVLRELLVEGFSESELRDLCPFELDVDYESLPGQGKAGKTRELILYLKRRSRIGELIEVGRRKRPDLPWETVF
jgi:S1-C subfamily serine protease